MEKEKNRLPLIFEKILEAIEEKGGKITSDEFKKIIYNIRFTEDEIINELYDIDFDRKKVKTIYSNVNKRTKNDAKEIKNWLNHNGYITINHGYQKEIITTI